MKLVRTRRGARLVHGSSILSELLREPGPTHSVFDLFAAATALFAEPSAKKRGAKAPRVAMLGFAGGGTVAPLRAVGYAGKVEAVDMDTAGVKLFRKFCGDWVEPVTVDEADAAQWLASRRGTFDVILEDLSVNLDDDVGKPEVSFTRLPELMARRLAPSGVAVLNALPTNDTDWPELVSALARPWNSGVQVIFDEWVNRFVLVGKPVGAAEKLEVRLRDVLRAIGSEMAGKFRLEPWRR